MNPTIKTARLLKRAVQQAKLVPGCAEASGQSAMGSAGEPGVGLSRALHAPAAHLRSGSRGQRGPTGLGVRFNSLFKQTSSSHLAAAAAPLLQALHFSSTTSPHALKDVLPFTIHSPNPKPAHNPEEELQHIDAAFRNLSKDPLYQYSTLQSSPLPVTFDGLKTSEAKSLLDYASLAEQEQSSAQDTGPEADSSDNDQALYNYAMLHDDKSSDS